jgi:oligopeptide/dipeptide ABC transporter ATP-binding protein
MTSLNPVLQVGFQIAETVITHQPRSLAERKLARSRATEDGMDQILKLLKEGADETVITRYAESKGLRGIETQVLNVWRRNDLGEAKKEKIILSLHSEKLGSFEKRVLESVERGKGMPSWMTGVSRATRIVLKNIERRKGMPSWMEIPGVSRATRIVLKNIETGKGMPSWMEIPGVSRAAKNVLLKEGYAKAIELLSMLEVPNPDKVVRMYPHELSGGMRQRIVIAIALANNPDLVILDEPTSALDVTVQAQILELTRHLKQRFNTSFIFISHDLSVLSEVCDRIGIMYAGSMVEVAPTDVVFNNPLHPYTKMLTRAIPRIEGYEIQGVGGTVPDMRNVPQGCAFHPRCPDATEKCRTIKPEMLEVEAGHFVACFPKR